MISYAWLCRELFQITQLTLGTGGSGREWECLVKEPLARRGVRSDVLTGGYSLQGYPALSGSDQSPMSPTSATIDGALDRHEFWPDCVWTSIHSTPGRFEGLIGRYPLGEAVDS